MRIKILLIGLMLLLVTGCGNNTKEVKNLDDFYNAASEKELIVSDNMAKYNVSYITGAMIADKDDLSIEMIIYDNDDSAKKIQEEHINSFMNRKSSSMIVKKYSGKNFYKYTMITNGHYLVSSRVENTLIFTKTELQNKDLVDSILDAIGY